ncbi:MAG: class I SAM-dependent methyltransferase [Egibacteraceae bacterium]
MPDTSGDCWLDWIVHGRDVDDRELQRRSLEHLIPLRDTVLDQAALSAGDVCLDVGCGDGLIGIGALRRVGSSGGVIFSDISAGLLERSRQAVAALGLPGRADFVLTSAEDLAGIPGGSVDGVLMRSVLIYVQDRAAAFRAFHRVLKPGGRLSIFEPMSSFFAQTPDGEYFGWDVGGVEDLATKVEQVFFSTQPPGEDPMTTLTFEELARSAEEAGFRKVAGRLVVSSSPPPPGDEADVTYVLRSRPNPKLVSTEEAARLALSPTEAETFLRALRAAVAKGLGRLRSAHAFLSATR